MLSEKNPTTSANDSSNGSTKDWTNHAEGKVVDDVYASATSIAAWWFTRYLKLTNFEFAIPTWATILWIEAKVTRRAWTSAWENIKDEEIILIWTDIETESKADTSVAWPASTTPTLKSYGWASDTWWRTWTAGEINSSAFWILISAKNYDASSRYAYVDWVTIWITYSEAGNSSNFFALM